MPTLHVMTVKDGDITTSWDRRKPDEVRVAQEAFDAAKEKKMLIYGENAKGERTLMRTFDPKAEKIVATPQMVGG